jgi:hypothetical protein
VGVAFLLALAATSFYAATARGVFVFGDDVLVFQVAEALVERGEVRVSSPADRGVVARSVAGPGGANYSKYGIGLSLVAAPFYAASGTVSAGFELPETRDAEGNLRTGVRVFGTSLASAVAAGAAVGVTFLLALELGLPAFAALAVALALAHATLLAHYATTFLSEPLSALCLATACLGFARAESAPVPRPGPLALSGFASGLLLATKVAQGVAIVALALGVLHLARSRPDRRWLGLLAWAAPVAAWALAVALYDQARFGSPFATGYGGEATRFTTPIGEGLAGLALSPGKGILWFSPVVLVSLLGFRSLAGRRPAFVAVALAMIGSLVALDAKYYQWWGGDCWGPRLLVPLLPLLALPAGEVFARWRTLGRWRRAAVGLLVLASVFVAALPILVPFDAHAERLSADPARLHRTLWTVGGSPILAAAAEFPGAVRETAARLAGGVPFAPDDGSPRYPDAAFVRYGSHALLQWSRAGLALTALFYGLALAAARRLDQKACSSIPPQ